MITLDTFQAIVLVLTVVAVTIILVGVLLPLLLDELFGFTKR